MDTAVNMQIHTEPLTALDRTVYKILYAAVTPRPIAWVSTVDADGTPNLAPYSFFNAICSHPPSLLFCPSYREAPNPKDTLANIRATGEFVVNFVTESNAAAMNITAQETAPHVNEFEQANLTPLPSEVVKAPRVAESPIHFECRLNQIVPVSEAPGGGYVVIGTVVMMHVDDSIYDAENNYIDFDAYPVIGRMAGNGYTTTRHRFDLRRPPSDLR
jgi:flavin reductase (DIM6/NTAB) family NADH-FMN oxidoreductase RutF